MPDNTISTGKPSIGLSELSRAINSGISGPVRALLISRSGTGFVIQEIRQGESILNIRVDLISHLNECPYTDDWLNNLRDSISQRLARRRLASQAGSLCIPSRNGWEPMASK